MWASSRGHFPGPPVQGDKKQEWALRRQNWGQEVNWVSLGLRNLLKTGYKRKTWEPNCFEHRGENAGDGQSREGIRWVCTRGQSSWNWLWRGSRRVNLGSWRGELKESGCGQEEERHRGGQTARSLPRRTYHLSPPMCVWSDQNLWQMCIIKYGFASASGMCLSSFTLSSSSPQSLLLLFFSRSVSFSCFRRLQKHNYSDSHHYSRRLITAESMAPLIKQNIRVGGTNKWSIIGSFL